MTDQPAQVIVRGPDEGRKAVRGGRSVSFPGRQARYRRRLRIVGGDRAAGRRSTAAPASPGRGRVLRDRGMCDHLHAHQRSHSHQRVVCPSSPRLQTLVPKQYRCQRQDVGLGRTRGHGGDCFNVPAARCWMTTHPSLRWTTKKNRGCSRLPPTSASKSIRPPNDQGAGQPTPHG